MTLALTRKRRDNPNEEKVNYARYSSRRRVSAQSA